ncbi:putative cytochrome c oxidase subunit 5C-4 [Apium graveolens]|uniref:putative cytochrome c oxidase subunit 5C-4 n=1 Tax=Apium graveolens TaxID=4045 RepID=UPI003D7AA8FA
MRFWCCTVDGCFRTEWVVLKRLDILIGITLSFMAGGLWKMHHWNNQRRSREFYNMLHKGVISVVVEDE